MRVLDFERPVLEIEERIRDLELSLPTNPEVKVEIESLREQAEKLRKKIYSNLTRWHRVQIARHPDRPHAIDHINHLCEDLIELHGDRCFRDDPALIAGIGISRGKRIAFLGQEKGRKTEEKIYRNFGMLHPEGYRKAMRIMDMAAKFGLPVVSFVDTPGAYPGVGAEERGQFSAIANAIKKMLQLPVPTVVTVIGEGGSGGALGVAIGDTVMAMEFSFYSVISPEGCASILWRDASQADRAAEALKMTAPDLLQLGVIDRIIPEPEGGAHRDPEKAQEAVKNAIHEELEKLSGLAPQTLIRRRWDKFTRIGFFREEGE
ncbi:MAG: acetyl-CoA carboxylase carboxyltransferase subunit alpha [candidate division WOR-3 bacterium]